MHSSQVFPKLSNAVQQCLHTCGLSFSIVHYYFLDQELISYRYSSCCSSSVRYYCWGGATVFKIAHGYVISNRIGVKFGRKVLQLNMHRLTVGFLILCHTFKTAAVTSFYREKCCCLASAGA